MRKILDTTLDRHRVLVAPGLLERIEGLGPTHRHGDFVLELGALRCHRARLDLAAQAMVDAGIRLIKYWLEVSVDVQDKRFRDRIEDPRKIWKLSPMDVKSYQRWYEYSRARDDMFTATDHVASPWHIVPSDHKRRARLNCISHLLSQIDYEEIPEDDVDLGERSEEGAYDDQASLEGRSFVPPVY